jgi:hypothetical protein
MDQLPWRVINKLHHRGCFASTAAVLASAIWVAQLTVASSFRCVHATQAVHCGGCQAPAIVTGCDRCFVDRRGVLLCCTSTVDLMRAATAMSRADSCCDAAAACAVGVRCAAAHTTGRILCILACCVSCSVTHHYVGVGGCCGGVNGGEACSPLGQSGGRAPWLGVSDAAFKSEGFLNTAAAARAASHCSQSPSGCSTLGLLAGGLGVSSYLLDRS